MYLCFVCLKRDSTSTKIYIEIFLIDNLNFFHDFFRYVIRCKKYDDFGKVVLDFQLEVCHLVGRPPSPVDGSGTEVYGVRHKRLKGDAFVYKRMCEDILKDVGDGL